jgi:hypothetical protein
MICGRGYCMVQVYFKFMSSQVQLFEKLNF